MASGAELSEFSPSTAKKRKVQESINFPSSPESIDQNLDNKPPIKQNNQDFEGQTTDSNGFSELSDGIKSASSSFDATNSSNTPTTTDSLSDDTGFPLDPVDDKDEVSSTVSNLSDLTGISMLSDDDESAMPWRNASSWVQKQIQMGTDPREILRLLFSDPTQVPEQVDDITLWRIVVNMMSEPPRRQKLTDINTIRDVVELIRKSKNIIVLTGAGVSVSCGIPDFRSRDGIYSRLAQDFPDLPDPQAMFDINYFSQDPRPFFKFAREIYPGQFKPSPCHEFIKMLEKQKKLLRNYSQNIDTLERVAGIKNLIECHGSFATASCTKCKHQVPADAIRKEIFSQTIPMCQKCKQNNLPSIGELNLIENYRDLVDQGVMKPDIVFFGEGLPDAFHDAMANDKDVCDLLIVIGSSLKVRPVALIPSSIPSHVPQILINRESLAHLDFDVELLGDGDVVINQLCHMLDESFKEVCWRNTVLREVKKLLPPQYSVNDSWDQNQDTLMNQDTSHDSQRTETYIENSEERPETSTNRSTEDGRENILDARPWKKLKNDLFGDEPRFYSKITEDNKLQNVHKPLNGSSNEAREKDCKYNLNIKSWSHTDDIYNNAGRSTDYLENTEDYKLIKEDIREKPHKMNYQNLNGDCNLTESCMQVADNPSTSYDSSSREFSPVESNTATLSQSETSTTDSSSSELKPRHASIDSVMDSALGDSCSSTDCHKRKHDEVDYSFEEDDDKNIEKLDDNDSWHELERESLAARLPENSYYQMKPGKYIFPGAEVYTNFPWNEGLLRFGSLRSSGSCKHHVDH